MNKSLQGLPGDSRRRKIMDWLREEGNARVRTLAEAFDVSEVTIRQDLERLESNGLVVREHGGAYLKSVSQQVRSLSLEHQENKDKKERIGRAAAALVSEGETIILDSGSTTTEVAANLIGIQNLTVVTNALNIALLLGAEPDISVHVSGGQFKPPTLSVSGERSAAYFEGLYAQTLFLATAAVDIEFGLSFPSLSDIPVKTAMVKAAQKVCLVADSTKISEKSFCRLGGIEIIDTLITDAGISDRQIAEFDAANVEVVVA